MTRVPICRVCGDNRALESHERCAECMAMEAQVSGEVFDGESHAATASQTEGTADHKY